jgi:hypothetical protein
MGCYRTDMAVTAARRVVLPAYSLDGTVVTVSWCPATWHCIGYRCKCHTLPFNALKYSHFSVRVICTNRIKWTQNVEVVRVWFMFATWPSFRTVSIFASYFGSPGFESRSEDQVSCPRFVAVFWSPLQTNAVQNFNEATFPPFEILSSSSLYQLAFCVV